MNVNINKDGNITDHPCCFSPPKLQPKMEEDLETLLGLYSSGNYDKCVSWLSSISDSSSGMRLLLNITFKDKSYEEFLIENNFAVCQSIVSIHRK